MQTRESVHIPIRGAHRFNAVLPGCDHLTVYFTCLKFAPILTSSSMSVHLYVSDMLKDLEQQLEDIRKVEEQRSSLFEVPNI